MLSFFDDTAKLTVILDAAPEDLENLKLIRFACYMGRW
jgi:hypothetical protein